METIPEYINLLSYLFVVISSSMRDVGVCLPIASDYFAGTDFSVPMLAFSGIMIPMNMVFALVFGRMARGTQENEAARVDTGKL